MTTEERRPDIREPAFNAPWPPLLLALLLIALYPLQPFWNADRYALIPHEVVNGRWTGLLGSLFLHGGWAHVVLNALGLLAFGAPVARLFGLGPTGALGFLLFYLTCGVAAGVGYVLLHPDTFNLVIGASGAVSGLMGAASRLMDGPGRLAPFTSRRVIGMAGAWLIVNLLVGLVGRLPGTGEAGIAWEAHLAGYAAGLLLIGPVAALALRVPR